MEERIIQLINADIDGEITSSERQELESVLESSADARDMRSELLKLNNLLDSMPMKEPPTDLSHKILDQIKLPAGKKTFSLAGLFSSFQPVTVGVAFAAGLLVTVSFYEMIPGIGVPGDTAGMVGTMVSSQARTTQAVKNDIFLEGDGFSGTVSLNENAGIYVLNFDLDSENRTDVQVGLGRTGLAFGGFAEVKGNADEVMNSVAISGSTLKVQNLGRQQFAVFLRETHPGEVVDTKSITIDFSSNLDSNYQGEPES